MHHSSVAALLLASVTVAAPAIAQPSRPVPLRQLVGTVEISHETFTLPNGLRVIVSTDRKAPVVAVSVWYDVGSKHEPKGQTGFAHLFEHLMFNGSENAPGDFFAPMQAIGATDMNGTTSFDRTNYFQTVPKEALARTLFLESDRMGHLLGAVSQSTLDIQRGVVQNEKRQGDNQPYGLADYRMTEALYPAGHPYAHTPIGSMADLDRASLDDVKRWFRDHYGPNNAVLALAGDIDVATARALVTRYFGDIPAGPRTTPPHAPVPTLSAPVDDTMTDRVSAIRIQRAWTIPGMSDPESASLTLAGAVLGGGLSSRLRDALVVRERLATSAEAYAGFLAQGGTLEISVDLHDGVDPAAVTRRLDAIVAQFLRDGPTADELLRVATRNVTGQLRALDSVGGFSGKASTLAKGLLMTGDAGFYRTQLDWLAAATPAQVRAVARKWLGRPAYTLVTRPGDRGAYAEAAGVTGAAKVPPASPPAGAGARPVGNRGPAPAVPPVAALSFPQVQRTTLSNGIPVVYAQRPTAPVTYLNITFDAGTAADAPDRSGEQRVVAAMLDQGTRTLDTIAFAQERDRLGLRLSASGRADDTRAAMDVPSVNLAPALALFGSMVRDPRFDEGDLSRVRSEIAASIRSSLSTPFGLSSRVSAPLLYGAASPYGRVDDQAVVQGVTRADLVTFQHAWLRPEKARIYVVSDRPLAEVRGALDRAFGDWKPAGAAGTKQFPPLAPATPRIVLVDLPGTPQSLVTGYQPTALKGRDDLLVAETANEALAGGFLGRINMDLRETRNWTYGASGRFRPLQEAVPYTVTSSIQQDRTGAAIAAIRDDITRFNTTEPMTQVEFDRTVTGATRELSGQFETSLSVLQGIVTNDRFARPDDYYTTLAARYRAMTRPQLAGALKPLVDPARMFWVVVGDAAKVEPQLGTLGLPVQVVPATSLK